MTSGPVVNEINSIVETETGSRPVSVQVTPAADGRRWVTIRMPKGFKMFAPQLAAAERKLIARQLADQHYSKADDEWRACVNWKWDL